MIKYFKSIQKAVRRFIGLILFQQALSQSKIDLSATYYEYLRSSNPKKTKTVCKKLRDLAASHNVAFQMYQNLITEPRLSLNDWDTLFDTLYQTPPGNIATKKVITEFCRKRLRNGEPAIIEKDVVLGKVLCEEDYINMLLKKNYSCSEDDAIETLMIQKRIHPSKFPRVWKKNPIGEYNIWSTFDLTEKQCPFGNPEPPKDKILCMLGLESQKGNILIFEYLLPKNVIPRIPTFTDAYAGNYWLRYFRPAIIDEPYGRTMPTDTCKAKTGRPEVVHEVIRLENLKKPLRNAQ